MSATVHTSDPPPIGMLPRGAEVDAHGPEQEYVRPARIVTTRARPSDQRAGAQARGHAREPRLDEQSPAVLVTHIARLEASMGAALSLLRRCIVERKTPTRDALAAEASFALGMSREAALDELEDVAQIVGVSSLR